MPTVTRTFRHQNGLLARDTLVVVRDPTSGDVVTSDQTNSDGLFAAWMAPGSYVFDVMGVQIPFTVAPGGDSSDTGLAEHIASPNPHPAYDVDIQDLAGILENGLI